MAHHSVLSESSRDEASILDIAFTLQTVNYTTVDSVSCTASMPQVALLIQQQEAAPGL